MLHYSESCKVNIGIDKLKSKCLENSQNIQLQTVQVKLDSEKKMKSTKLSKRKLSVVNKKSIDLPGQGVTCQHKTNNLEAVKVKENTQVGKHVHSDKLENQTVKKISDRAMKHTVKRKYLSDDKIYTHNTNSGDNEISAFTTQKQKAVDCVKGREDVVHLFAKDLSKGHILQCISAIFHLSEKQLKHKNALFDGEGQPVFLQVTCIRVPKTPRRCIRVLLPHSMVMSTDEVVLFVGDLERGRRKDYEPTVEHYEDLLRKHGCTRIKNIIPMNQVKTEYDQYELKRKLVGSYDHFLVDGKIAGHLSHLLGKVFYKKRKLPISIKMENKDLKQEIDYALRKTAMQMHSHGDTHIIQIGHTLMQKEEIFENVLATCRCLSKKYPGGWLNIRSILIKTSVTPALPIYATLKNKNMVKIPVVQPARPRAYHNVSGELTTANNVAKVIVTPEGHVTVVERKRKKNV